MAVIRRKEYREIVNKRQKHLLPRFLVRYPPKGLSIDSWMYAEIGVRPYTIKERAGRFLFYATSKALIKDVDDNLLIAIYEDDPLNIVLYDEKPLRLMKEVADAFKREYGWEVTIEIRQLVAVQL